MRQRMPDTVSVRKAGWYGICRLENVEVIIIDATGWKRQK
jgi:hypothetical protein